MLYYNYLQGRYILDLPGVRYTLKALTVEEARIEARTLKRGSNMQTFYFEVTDTFSGELNYCWLNRFAIKAKTIRGALIKLSKHTGLNYRNNGIHYKAKNACIAAYELEHDVDSPWLDRAETL